MCFGCILRITGREILQKRTEGRSPKEYLSRLSGFVGSYSGTPKCQHSEMRTPPLTLGPESSNWKALALTPEMRALDNPECGH